MNTITAGQSAESGRQFAEHDDEQLTSASPAPPLSPTCPIRPGVWGDEKDWWGSNFVVTGKHQESTMPANFAQIFEENFLQGLGEQNSSGEIFIKFHPSLLE
jgi:hypothetical protein